MVFLRKKEHSSMPMYTAGEKLLDYRGAVPEQKAITDMLYTTSVLVNSLLSPSSVTTWWSLPTGRPRKGIVTHPNSSATDARSTQMKHLSSG
jgi:hypothetical protein